MRLMHLSRPDDVDEFYRMREVLQVEWAAALVELDMQLNCARNKEKFIYHSIAHQPSLEDVDVVRFPYKPADLAEPLKVDLEDTQRRVAFSQAIPRDGRIQLPFDFHWWLQYEIFRWKKSIVRMPVKHERETANLPPLSDKDGNGSEMFRAGTSERRKYETHLLESFFGKDFQTGSRFIIRDFDPWTTAHVTFDIGRSQHASVSVPATTGGQEIGNVKYTKMDIDEQADIFDWLATQKLFCQVDPPRGGIAPWQRTILCEGLDLAPEEAKTERSFPFLTFRESDPLDPVKEAADMYLAGECRGGTEGANPYSDPAKAFHIVFFERVRDFWLYDCMKRRDDLKIGRLYSRPQGTNDGNNVGNANDDVTRLAFRRSCFTATSATSLTVESQNDESDWDSNWYWTMLILYPTYGNRTNRWKIDTGHASRPTAELSCIAYGLEKIVNQWRDLNDYMRSLLAEDFMDPTEYCQLLFDDATFRRSRLYFWALGCLTEFDTLLEDTIMQWKLYRLARVEPILDPPPKAKVSFTTATAKAPPSMFNVSQDRTRLGELDMKAQQLIHELEYLRAQFQAKQINVLALRDGLFNASALMESRSSTHLGMNVQLLTYVSIFYLPLAFCAALWAIPNITSRQTQTPFVVTAVLVGFLTYMAVFNLENLAKLPGRLYSVLRNTLLRKMKEDKSRAWRARRELFEVFPPNEEQRKPSEWWILWYLRHLLWHRRDRLWRLILWPLKQIPWLWDCICALFRMRQEPSASEGLA